MYGKREVKERGQGSAIQACCLGERESEWVRRAGMEGGSGGGRDGTLSQYLMME